MKAALPEAPHDNVGFEIRAFLPPGRPRLTIEAGLADGSWRVLICETVIVRRRIVPFWLGGGTRAELFAFQMPAQMAYPARSSRPDRLPARRPGPARPRISVVTPSYQQGAYLEQTMRSVLDQMGPTDEYVVQDGGSTDGSVAIITRHSEKLRAWSSAPDQGQADAIAKGFAQTTGAPADIMAWLNSDDTYLPGTFDFVADYFARHPDVDVVYGHRILIDEQSREIGRWFLPPHDDTVLRLNDFVPQETVFWRRRVWDKVGGLDASFKFALDWDLLLRFADAGAKIVRVPYFLACFRIHAAQKTSAQMASVGQAEIDRLRTRANGRPISPAELEAHPRLIRYLRHSAFIQFLWRLGIRAP
ncbi:MAG: glycosyltransferase [Opitutae bacterium]|nr:glycosyltransferase [Opitutae bacterium]